MRNWLRDARIAMNLTQEQVADAVNMNRISYVRLENGKSGNYLSVVKFYALATLLQLPIEEAVIFEIEYSNSINQLAQVSSSHLAV